MVDATLTATKMSLKYEKGSYTYSKLKHGAAKDKIYELATAINTLQDEEPAKKITRIVETRLDSILI